MDELLIRKRLTMLEQRVANLEAYLVAKGHLVPDRPDERGYVAPREQIPVEPVTPAIAEPLPRIPPSTPPAPLNIPMAAVATGHSAAASTPLPPPLPRTPLVYQPPPAKPKRAPRRGSEFENWIGLNWTGWVGAIVLVVGAALGIKYAYDQGWLGGLPREVRLGLCFLGGVALLATGEWVDRKINRLSAACVFGAGVATLFVVSYAGFGYFELYAQSVAFVLMAISAFIGAGLALRKNLLSIAVLSLLGGHLAPVILQSDQPRYAALLGYVLTLQLIGLVLAACGRGAKWGVIRAMSIVMPSLWVGVVYGDTDAADVARLPFAFSITYWVASQAELVRTSIRRATERRWAVTLMMFSIFATSLLALSLVYGLRHDGRYTQGASILMLAGVCGAVAFILRRRSTELAAGFRIQSAVLMLASVPVMLDGAAVVVAWAICALAYAVVGERVGSKLGRWFATAAWGGAVIFLSLWVQAKNSPALEMVRGIAPLYVLLAAGLALVGHALASVVAGRDDRQDVSDDAFKLGVLLDLFAAAVFSVAAIYGVPLWQSTAVIAVYAWLLVIADRAVGRLVWSLCAAATLLLAVVKWGAVDMLAAPIAAGLKTGPYTPVVNPVMLLGTFLAGSLCGMYALNKRSLNNLTERYRVGAAAMWVATLVIAIMTYGLTLEITRAVDAVRATGATRWPPLQLQLLGQTLLWSAAVAIHAALAVRLTAEPKSRHNWLTVGAVAMSIVTVKFVIADTLLFLVTGRTPAVVPFVNLQTLAAAVVSTATIWVWWLLGREGRPLRFAGSMVLVIALLTVTVEIDRAFAPTRFLGPLFVDPALAKQVAISLYWAVFAVGSVVAGFRIRLAGLRYAGLALLGVALAKVVLFDLRELGRGYRILSFLGVGALLLLTSVLYGKFGSRFTTTGSNTTTPQSQDPSAEST